MIILELSTLNFTKFLQIPKSTFVSKFREREENFVGNCFRHFQKIRPFSPTKIIPMVFSKEKFFPGFFISYS